MYLDESGVGEKREAAGYFISKKKAKIGGVSLAAIVIFIIIITRYASKNSSPSCSENNLNKSINYNYECSHLYCKNPGAKLSGINQKFFFWISNYLDKFFE